MSFPEFVLRRLKSSKLSGIGRIAWPLWSVFFAGLASCIWYLVRVVPKPSRAAYPCQRAAAPIRIGFIAWWFAFGAYALSFSRARAFLRARRYSQAVLYLAISAVGLLVFVGSDARISYAAPLGTGKGIYPGRVVWVYNPNAAKWTGAGNYWDASVNPQAEYSKAFTLGIMSLSGGTNDSTSWDALFRYFNGTHSRPGTGYQAGDKIAIKINQNNSPAPAADHGDSINANPQTCVAILASLVRAGVPQTDIWIGDPSRAVTDNIYNAIRAGFPLVNVVDYFGNNGRCTTGVVTGVFPQPDVKNAESACFYNARYIINQPLLKGHIGQIFSFGSKNFYGVNGILPDWTKNGGHPGDSALSRYMTNLNFGGKVILWAMDAMYPAKELDTLPYANVSLAPFNGRPMASFILSMDGCAEECVSYDFWSAITGVTGGTDYITIAAANGGGVQDHWNNATDKQYVKNLAPAADGIELVYVDGSRNGALPRATGHRQAGLKLLSPDGRSIKVILPSAGSFKLRISDLHGRTVRIIAIDHASKGATIISAEQLGARPGMYLGRVDFAGQRLDQQIRFFR